MHVPIGSVLWAEYLPADIEAEEEEALIFCVELLP